MPKALLIAPQFPPVHSEPSVRAMHFCQHLPDFGWEPHVLTAAQQPQLPRDAGLLHNISSHTKVWRTPAVLPEHIEDWMPLAQRSGLRIIHEQKVDLILASGPPFSAWRLAHKLAQKSGLPWIGDAMALWQPEHKTQLSGLRHWHATRQQQATATALTSVNRMLVSSDAMRTHVLRLLPHLARARVHVLPHGYDRAEHSSWPDGRTKQRFTLTNLGETHARRSLGPVLNALKKLFDRKPEWRDYVKLQQLGTIGPHDRNLLARMNFGDTVEVYPKISHQDQLRALQYADVLLLLNDESPNSELNLPPRLFEYIASERPVLGVGRGDSSSAQLMHELRLGWFFAADDAQRIAAALEYWVEKQRNGGIPFVPASHPRFERRNLVRDLAKILENSLLEKAL